MFCLGMSAVLLLEGKRKSTFGSKRKQAREARVQLPSGCAIAHNAVRDAKHSACLSTVKLLTLLWGNRSLPHGPTISV